MQKHTPEYIAHLRSPKWRALRKAKISLTHNRCERCGSWYGRREVHHKTYERLGDETLDDLMVLCSQCHVFEDQLRAREAQMRARDALADAIYDNGRNTYMTKKYGLDWEYGHWDSEEYDEWLESKRREND